MSNKRPVNPIPKTYKQILQEKAKRDPLYSPYIDEKGELVGGPNLTIQRDPSKPKFPYGRNYKVK